MPSKTEAMLRRLVQHRASGAVERYHVLRTHRAQTVADHSHGVATLLTFVSPECSATLLKAALMHDFHERDTGDMPSTAKWAYPELAKAMQAAEDSWNQERGLNFKLTPNETSLLKYCDYMELMVWSWEELQLGNRFAGEPLNNIVRVLDIYPMPNEAASALYKAIKEAASEYLYKEVTK